MHQNRILHTASVLPNGKVLIAGGADFNLNICNSTEIYDPTISNWTNAGNLFLTAEDRTVSLLKKGNVSVSGNELSNELPSNISMLYNSSMETFTPSDNTRNLQSSRKIFMAVNEKTSIISKENLTISKDKQLH
jgi:hypothetical protein